MHAHRCMWERMGDELELSDFYEAMRTHLNPLVPAVQALHSQDPRMLARYEDLLPRDFSLYNVLANEGRD